jgi:hypothetical protein
MSAKHLLVWFSVVSAIWVLFGITCAFFGLAILPVDRITLLPWESAIYGAIMMGWGTTLLGVGRLAFRRNDPELMRALLYGVVVWLIVEAAFSAYLRVCPSKCSRRIEHTKPAD